MRKTNIIITGDATMASIIAAIGQAKVCGMRFDVDQGYDLNSGEEIIIIKGVFTNAD